MSDKFSSNVTRKEFIHQAAKIGGFILSYGVIHHVPLRAQNSPFHVALLADTHIAAYKNEQYRGFYPAKNLEKVVNQVSGIHPEAMIITGDVARLSGELGDYAAIQQQLQPLKEKMPVFMALGNHDDRNNFNKTFDQKTQYQQEINNKHVLVIDREDIRILLLDSLMFVNITPGLLGRQQREWLKDYLDDKDKRPVFLFVHHTLNDGDGDLLDADRLFNIISGHKKVKAIFFGHSHVYSISERNKVKLINIPAVGYNFIDSQPVGWLEARIGADSGEFILHAIDGNQVNDGERKVVKWR